MRTDQVRYRVRFRIETEDGFHQTSTKTAGTLWGLVQEINNLFEQDAQILGVEKECWAIKPLNSQERDTIEMLTHGRVKS